MIPQLNNMSTTQLETLPPEPKPGTVGGRVAVGAGVPVPEAPTSDANAGAATGTRTTRPAGVRCGWKVGRCIQASVDVCATSALTRRAGSPTDNRREARLDLHGREHPPKPGLMDVTSYLKIMSYRNLSFRGKKEQGGNSLKRVQIFRCERRRWQRETSILSRSYRGAVWQA